jgi:hypothetical protein
MKIIFTQEYKVKDKTGKVFSEGETLECNSTTERHFTRKGVAKPAIERPVAKPKQTISDTSVGAEPKKGPGRPSKSSPDSSDKRQLPDSAKS